MSHINLLPWRELKRKEQQRQFLVMLGLSALLGLALVIAGHVFMNQLITRQEARNARLNTEIALVDKRIKEIKKLEKLKQALLDRMEIIQQLQQSRPEAVHLFDELVTTLPDGLYLTSVAQNGDMISIQGKAESDARVSTYMRNLERSPWFKEPTLGVIETRKDNRQNNNDNLRSFTLTVKKTHPDADARGDNS